MIDWLGSQFHLLNLESLRHSFDIFLPVGTSVEYKAKVFLLGYEIICIFSRPLHENAFKYSFSSRREVISADLPAHNFESKTIFLQPPVAPLAF